MNIKSGLLTFFVLGALYVLWADTQVSVSSTHNVAAVGDRVMITILVKTDEDFDDINLEIPDNKIYEIVDEKPLEKRAAPEGTVFEKRYEVAFFDLGDFSLGPYRVELLKQSKKLKSLSTNEVPIKISSLLKEADQDIFPEKPPLPLNGSPIYLLKYLWIPLIVIILALSVWFLRYRQTHKKPVRLLLSPVEIFERDFNKLLDERLFEKGFFMFFYLRLTQLIRVFLHRHHRIKAEEMTSEELKSALESKSVTGKRKAAFFSCLETGDLVKFARYEPCGDDFDRSLADVREIVAAYKEDERQARLLIANQEGRK